MATVADYFTADNLLVIIMVVFITYKVRKGVKVIISFFILQYNLMPEVRYIFMFF